MTTYRAARIFLGDGGPPVTEFRVNDGLVAADDPDGDVVDLGDIDVMPGFVDLHADSLARFEQPRTGVTVPLRSALEAFDADAVLAGVTTPFLCCSLEEGTTAHRSPEHAGDVLATLEEPSIRLVTDLRVHLRVDVTSDACVSALGILVGRFRRRVGLISYMDHTPGQGQYPTEEAWRRAYQRQDAVTEVHLDERLARYERGAAGIADRRTEIAAIARGAGIPLASHDDDDAASVETAARLGVVISEFPVTEAAAVSAHAAGLAVVVGAPNLWRGASHGTGLSARACLATRTADVITSDYQLGAIVPGLRAAADAGILPMERLVATVTHTAAVAVGLRDRGLLLPGGLADFVTVAGERVTSVWRRGEQVLERRYRGAAAHRLNRVGSVSELPLRSPQSPVT